MSDLPPKSITHQQLGELKTLLQNGERVRFYFKYRDYTGSDPAIRDIKGEYGIMGVLKKTFRREKAISAK